VANDGREGLAIVEPAGFYLLILDLILPGATGFEIARQLWARRRPHADPDPSRRTP
jgi:CheY-like chemotaxis protein